MNYFSLLEGHARNMHTNMKVVVEESCFIPYIRSIILRISIGKRLQVGCSLSSIPSTIGTHQFQ